MKQKFFLCVLLIWGGVYAVDLPPQKPATFPNKSCAQLTEEEQLFASKLSRVEDQNFFCQSMTTAERDQVMAMTRPVSPDQAMQDYRKQMMKKDHGTPPSRGSNSPNNKPSSGGSCPIN